MEVNEMSRDRLTLTEATIAMMQSRTLLRCLVGW